MKSQRVTEVLRFEGNKVDYNKFYYPKRQSIVYQSDAYEFQQKFPDGKLNLEEVVNEVDNFTVNFRGIHLSVVDKKFEDTERVGVIIVIDYDKNYKNRANNMKNWFKERYKKRLESFKEPWKEEMDRRDFEARR